MVLLILKHHDLRALVDLWHLDLVAVMRIEIAAFDLVVRFDFLRRQVSDRVHLFLVGVVVVAFDGGLDLTVVPNDELLARSNVLRVHVVVRWCTHF